jgi:hypothetical protein
LSAGVLEVKQISIFIVGVAAAFAIVPAFAEDFTAGKTPAQLFRSDCGECHRSPNGLAKNADVQSLASFLSEHYTTKSETAAALAAYVSGFSSSGRNRGTGATTPPARDPGRLRSDAAPANSSALPGLSDEPSPRRRRAVSAPADAEKKQRRDDGDVPRPPRRVGSDSPKTNAPTRTGTQPSEAQDPISRVRAYLSSGMNSSEAGKTETPKARKRRKPADHAPAAGSGTTSSEAPAAAEPAAAAPPEPEAAAAQPAETPAADTTRQEQ